MFERWEDGNSSSSPTSSPPHTADAVEIEGTEPAVCRHGNSPALLWRHSGAL